MKDGLKVWHFVIFLTLFWFTYKTISESILAPCVNIEMFVKNDEDEDIGSNVVHIVHLVNTKFYRLSEIFVIPVQT